MAALIGALRVSLGAETAQFEQGMARSRRTLRETSKDFDSFSKTGALAVKGLFAGIGVGAAAGAAKAFLSIADEAKGMTAQIKLATAQAGDFNKAQADVARIATDVRAGLSETTGLYAAFVRSGQALGRSQEDSARATETFSKALKIGGASSEDAANATRQFNQALAGGVLRAEEFNSVVEASPRVAKLLADSLGVTVGELRKLVNEGKVTSDKLFAALTDRKFTAGIDAEFKEMPVTFDQAMTLVHNAAVTTFGAFDQGGGFSEMIAGFVSRGAEGFNDLARSAQNEGLVIRAAFAGLGDVFGPLLAGAKGAFGGIRTEANYTRDSIAGLLGFYDRVKNLGVGLDRGLQRLNNLNPFKQAQPLKAWSNEADKFLKRYDAEVEKRTRPSFAWADRQNQVIGSGMIGQAAPIAVKPPAAGGAGGKSKTKGGGTNKSSGPTLTDQTRQIIDSLYPDEAQIRDLQAKMATLGKALAAKVLPREEYQRAKDSILAEISDLRAKAHQSVDWGPAMLDRPTQSAADGNLIDTAEQLSKATTKGATEMDGLRAAFATLSQSGSGAMASIAGSIVTELIPAMMQAQTQAVTMQQRMMGVAGALTGVFQSIFGRKAGAIIGGIAQIGLSFGGFRAAGGPVSPGRSYIVGEKGPELFTPGMPGAILPNDFSVGAMPETNFYAGMGGGLDGSPLTDRAPIELIVTPSPYFDVRAAAAAQPAIQSMGVRAAAGATQMAAADGAKRQRRRLA